MGRDIMSVAGSHDLNFFFGATLVTIHPCSMHFPTSMQASFIASVLTLKCGGGGLSTNFQIAVKANKYQERESCIYVLP